MSNVHQEVNPEARTTTAISGPTNSVCPVLRDPDVYALEGNPLDLKRAYEELRAQYQRCAAALATAAHDLRTPLAVVSGYIELLKGEKLGSINEKQARVLEDMHISSIRLQRLVTDFLTFASLQTGKIPLRADDPQDINACLQELS